MKRDKWRHLLGTTLKLFCINGLPYKNRVAIDGLIAVTLDNDEIVLVKIADLVQKPGSATGAPTEPIEDSKELLPDIVQLLCPDDIVILPGVGERGTESCGRGHAGDAVDGRPQTDVSADNTTVNSSADATGAGPVVNDASSCKAAPYFKWSRQEVDLESGSSGVSLMEGHSGREQTDTIKISPTPLPVLSEAVRLRGNHDNPSVESFEPKHTMGMPRKTNKRSHVTSDMPLRGDNTGSHNSPRYTNCDDIIGTVDPEHTPPAKRARLQPMQMFRNQTFPPPAPTGLREMDNVFISLSLSNDGKINIATLSGDKQEETLSETAYQGQVAMETDNDINRPSMQAADDDPQKIAGDELATKLQQQQASKPKSQPTRKSGDVKIATGSATPTVRRSIGRPKKHSSGTAQTQPNAKSGVAAEGKPGMAGSKPKTAARGWSKPASGNSHAKSDALSAAVKRPMGRPRKGAVPTTSLKDSKASTASAAAVAEVKVEEVKRSEAEKAGQPAHQPRPRGRPKKIISTKAKSQAPKGNMVRKQVQKLRQKALDTKRERDPAGSSVSSPRKQARKSQSKGKADCQCDGCLCREDCQICKYCLDKPKFGGKNVFRRKCMLKYCTVSWPHKQLEIRDKLVKKLLESERSGTSASKKKFTPKNNTRDLLVGLGSSNGLSNGDGVEGSEVKVAPCGVCGGCRRSRDCGKCSTCVQQKKLKPGQYARACEQRQCVQHRAGTPVKPLTPTKVGAQVGSHSSTPGSMSRRSSQDSVSRPTVHENTSVTPPPLCS